MLLDSSFSAPVEDTHLFDCEAIYEVILPENNQVFVSRNSGKLNYFDSIRDGGQTVAFSRAWSTTCCFIPLMISTLGFLKLVR